MEIIELADLALREALKLGATDVSAICAKNNENQIRFSNNSITVTKNIKNLELFLYIAKDNKRMIGATSNPSAERIKIFASDLIKASEVISPSSEYTPLPKGEFSYPLHGIYDKKLAEDGVKLIDFAKEAVDAGIEAGATRVSGSLMTSEEEITIITSGDAKGKDKTTKILLNVRAFTNEETSGHGLSCAARIADFNPSEAGRVAGEYAKISINPHSWEEGIYDLVTMPTVTADIVQHIGSFSSAFTVDAGFSFLADKVDQKVGVDEFTLRDYGVVEGGLGGRGFDDEGAPTRENIIIEKGVLKGYLHNCTTARKFGKSSTGNAGIIEPHPWNLIVDPGMMSLDNIIKEVKKGILVTNNWYTRFQNMRTGEYSTIPRDATFLIENGKIKHPVSGLRISDSIPRQLNSILGISKDRRWIEWWEVSIPTLAPAMLIKDVTITKALQ
ncbi:MAG: TldD/PmbA family protein [Candidatus Methylarchaceae archaeon HK01M]|nr:TldD/PmbA family protein [Candidatus Methylarchaceae archaeon HK01M]